jgi:hypothetical protein
MGSKSAVAISLSKYLEERDRISPAPHVGIDTKIQAEPVPPGPMVLHCLGTLGSDAGLDPFINSAEINEQCICSHSGHTHQGRLCGKDELK